MANARPASMAFLLFALAVFGSACVTESESHSVAAIEYADPDEKFETLAIRVVNLDGKKAGTIETMYVIDGDSNDANDRYQHLVRDLNGGTVGFVTDSNKAFRTRAHQGPDLVANHDSLEKNVAMILGTFDGKVTFEAIPSTVEN